MDQGQNGTRTWRKVDSLCLLELGCLPSPSLRHLCSPFLIPETQTGPTPPAFLGLLLAVNKLWDFSAPPSLESIPHNKPPLMSISEKAVAPHSSTLAQKIPWMEEPGRLRSMGSLRVGHD